LTPSARIARWHMPLDTDTSCFTLATMSAGTPLPGRAHPRRSAQHNDERAQVNMAAHKQKWL